MKLFRKIFFWLHLIAGAIAGIVILTMCVTGALLSFEKNLTEFAERGMRSVAAPPTENARKLSVQEILDKVRAAKPDAKPSAIALPNESDAAWQLALGRDGQIFVDPYTGQITGESATTLRAFFRTVTDLHRWIALSGDARPIGKAITGACNLAFLFLAISGIYLWFPRRLSWRHFKAALTVRWKVKGKARNFNWHTVIGFWSSLVLIILTLTGTVISYQWASNLIFTLTGNEVPQQQQQAPSNALLTPGEQPGVAPENINAIWARAENQVENWKSISLKLPVAEDSAVFTLDEGKSWNIFGRSTLTINAKNTEVTKWEPYAEQNSARQIRSWFRFTHTGEAGGIVGQIIGFLACLSGAMLVWTGISLALRRLAGWRTKRTRTTGNKR